MILSTLLHREFLFNNTLEIFMSIKTLDNARTSQKIKLRKLDFLKTTVF